MNNYFKALLNDFEKRLLIAHLVFLVGFGFCLCTG